MSSPADALPAPVPPASSSASLHCPDGHPAVSGGSEAPVPSPTTIVAGPVTAGLDCQYVTGSLGSAPEATAAMTGDTLTNIEWQLNHLQPLCEPAKSARPNTTDLLLIATGSGGITDVSVVVDPGCDAVSTAAGVAGYAGPKLLAQLAALTGAASSAAPASPIGSAPNSYIGPEALAFPTATHGVLLGIDCPSLPGRCETFSEFSDDGGISWSRPTVLAATVWATPDNPPTQDLAADQLSFSTSEIGYAFGPELYQTTDGGQTWRELPVNGQVGALAASADSAWLVVDRGCAVACTGWELDVVGPDGVVHEAGRQPLTIKAPPAANGVGVPDALLRPTADTGYLASFGQVQVTRDGGRSWARVVYPCTESFFDPATLTASGAGVLFAVCAGEMGAGAEKKQFWTSSDSGATWHGPTTLEEMGYSDEVAAASDTVVWRYGDRGNLLHSSDSGSSWQVLLPGDFEDGFGAPTGFAALGPDRAWVLDPYGPFWTGPRHLYITADAGKTWRTVEILGNLMATDPTPSSYSQM
jgi:photosystem II stability/assembly factor-like uncharacterized protein